MYNRFSEIKKQIGKFIANFSVTEENGKTYIFDGDEIREGLDISTYDENNNVIPLPDGNYTIKGVECVVADGKVTELPNKNSKVEESEKKDEKLPKQPTEQLEEQPKQEDDLTTLRADNERLKAENESMKAELEELKKKPMAEPVPQRTNMSSQVINTISENAKGTKFEKACRIFGCN